MLYITTRNLHDAYTAHRAITSERCPNGGCFVPFRLPYFDIDAISQLKEKSYNQTIADILNAFFAFGFDKHDFPFDSERNFIRIVPMNHQIIMAELWHNLGNDYSYIEAVLNKKLAKAVNTEISADWPKIAIQIAIVFCLYGQLLREGLLNSGDVIDVSIPNDSLVSLMVIHYCRSMGLPINTIICACEEEGNIWDLINKGTLVTSGLGTPIKCGVERLLHATLGCEVVNNFVQACDKNKEFLTIEENIPLLNNGIFCTVAGKNRASSVINSVYRTNGYLASKQTALCYGGLQDYRAKTGNSVLTVIFAKESPLKCMEEVSVATGLTEAAIKGQLKKEV